ncbi:MAG: hypothetical protein IKA17_06960 [Clostridia bacterium]|nr:hypothetical protein [Clostridia bacterium]
MKKPVLILISFIVCAFSGLFYGWMWIFPVYFLFSAFVFGADMVWEVPLGALAASCLILFFPENLPELFKCFIFLGSVLISFFNPKKLFIYFPLCILLLFLKNDIAGIYALMGAIMGSAQKRTKLLKDCIIKQENIQDYKIDF